jgi:hypothetical protein
VILTPVPGEENKYDLVRADLPLSEGTPINKALLDNKAYALTEDVVLYVANSGNDIDGDGSVDAPFATVQKAVDSLPKYLDGHTAEISVSFGVYPERVLVKDFCGGRLVIGRYGEVFILEGIEIVNSSFVETNVYQIEFNKTGSSGLFEVANGSRVLINSDMIIDGLAQAATGIRAIDGSSVAVTGNRTITINNCAGAANAVNCSMISFDKIAGDANTFGLMAYRGSIITYNTDTLKKTWSNDANSGGLVLTGKNSTDLSNATLDL